MYVQVQKIKLIVDTDRIPQRLHSFSIFSHFHGARGSLLNVLLHFTCVLYRSPVVPAPPPTFGIRERKDPLPPKISYCRIYKNTLFQATGKP